MNFFYLNTDILATDSFISHDLSIRHNIPEYMTQVWRLIQKLILNFSNDNLNKKVKILDSNHLVFLSHIDNNKSDILELVVRTVFLVNDVPCKISPKLIYLNFNYKIICNHIYNTLLLNTLQKFIIKKDYKSYHQK